MTKAAQDLLRSFKALPIADQHEVLVQLLREPIEANDGTPSDDALVAAADLVFLAYDEAEKAS
jgi:hypothetical protein